MSNEDDIKRAEQLGYSKGYQAGKKRKYKVETYEQRNRKENAFWQRAFIAALPAAFAAEGWSRGEKQITALEDRVRLAADTADHSLVTAKTHLGGKL